MMGEIVDFSKQRQGGSDWYNKIMRGSDNVILKNVVNASVYIQYSEPLRGTVGWNEFTDSMMIIKAPPPAIADERPLPGPYPRGVIDADYTAIQCCFQRDLDMPSIKLNTVVQAAQLIARTNGFHPVCNWLKSLKWDGEERVKDWLFTVFGCEKTPYHEAVGTKFLVAAVKRVFEPGCKFDYVPVFEGGQGIGKSTVLRELFSDQWFKDDLSRDLGNKDAAAGLSGAWCVELGELQSMMYSSVEDTKAFLSRQVDKFRPAYGRETVSRARQCVFAGTTNNSEFLTDATGNRRFWPVKCEGADISYIRNHREQIWAEAVQLYQSGSIALWLDDEEVLKEAENMQKDKVIGDAWEDAVAQWLKDGCKTETTTNDILVHGFGKAVREITARDGHRIGNIMKGLGWVPQRKMTQGRKVRIWKKTGETLI